ncbi:MAG: D-inositol-3-phosphate glycosyltransferase [Jiangellaceae bacterium]
MLSVHTSPLDQPGAGDAGGMNVYVVELARRLAERGVEVDVFTRATSSRLPPVAQVAPGVTVRNVVAGPFENVDKGELPSHLCDFATGVLRVEAASDPGRYDLIHSHYWLSGQVGWLATERWDVPLVHSMHTMAKVKNLALADGDSPEPASRILGEEQVVFAADRLVANTAYEAAQLVALYDADPSKVVSVHPGVDLDVFSPGDPRAARRRLGLRDDDVVLLFAGRVQPLKAPDVMLHAVARLVADAPALRRRLVVAVVGGPSGSGLAKPHGLQLLARCLEIDDVVRFEPPVPQPALADWYRAADLSVVPSHNESFGLVALESQACGTPVVAAAVGGLQTAVADGRSGVLVDGYDPSDWAHAIATVVASPARRAALGAGALAHARRCGWDVTTDRMLDVYTAACRERDFARV